MARLVVFLVFAVLLLVGLWTFFEPQRPEASAAASPIAPTTDATRVALAAAPAQVPGVLPKRHVFELFVKAGRLASGPAIIQVREGEAVTLRVSSDANDELHLHGFDLHARLTPGATAELEFVANRTGRFGLEMHESHRELGALEIYPR